MISVVPLGLLPGCETQMRVCSYENSSRFHVQQSAQRLVLSMNPDPWSSNPLMDRMHFTCISEFSCKKLVNLCTVQL